MAGEPGQLPPGDIRAADKDRDAVVQILHQAFSEGRITSEEHSERTDAALNSKTYDDLFKLTADLIPQSGTHPGPRQPPGNRHVSPTELGPIQAVLGEVHRAGPYRVGAHTKITAFMGTVHIDLSEAVFTTQVAEFELGPSLSEIRITVPQGVGVRDETTKSLSDVNARSSTREAQAGKPTVVLRGALALSQLKIRVSR